MIAAGYMAKRVLLRPEGLNTPGVVNICSVSYCISEAFCDYIRHWKHNGYWFYDSPGIVEEVACLESIDLSDQTLFYYEVSERQYDEVRGEWQPFHAEEDFETEVEIPQEADLLGFDVVSYSAQTNPECSPLSCNNLAASLAVNEHCLLPSFDRARRLLEQGAFSESEPGPFRIIAVYSCEAA